VLPVSVLDLTSQSFNAAMAGRAADHLRSGGLLQLELLDPDAAVKLAGDLYALLTRHFNPAHPSFCQLLVSPGEILLQWGVEEHGRRQSGVERNFSLAQVPRLEAILAIATDIAAALRQPGEQALFSVIPSLRKCRSFPRFYHRDSHFSVDDVRGESTTRSAYRMIWDLGLENSHRVLNADFVPRAALLDRTGAVAEHYRHLFQRQNIEGYRDMSEGQINQIQQQLTEAHLPFPENRVDLLPGRALVCLDDCYFHTTYLRHGRRVEELDRDPRSILIIREFCHNSFREIDALRDIIRL